jgi:hypothetical protein
MRRRGARVVDLAVLLPAALLAACGDNTPPGFDIPPDEEIPTGGVEAFDPYTNLMRGPLLATPTRDSITILWATDLPASSVAEWGRTADRGSFAWGRTWRYSYGVDGDPPSGWLHEVTIRGLDPGTRYHYRVISLAAPTADSTFATAPDEGESFSIAIWGDTRSNHDDHAIVVDAIIDAAPDVGLFTGDMVSGASNDDNWTRWFTIEAPLVSRTPFFPCFGNHEDWGGGAKYDQTFVAPESALLDYYGEPSARTYSLDYGSLHAIMVDAYGDRAEVLRFVEEDLASPAAQAAKFRLMLLHPPLYTFATHRPDEDLRADLMPLARAGRVQLIATGHNHVYEHFWLDDIHHLVVGGGGGPIYNVNASTGLAGDTPDLRIAAYQGLSFVHATFTGDAATFRAVTPEGAVVDCFRIDATDDPVTLRGCKP